MCKIRVGLHRHVAKIATTYIFIVSCFSTLDVSLYFNIGNYYLPSQRKHKVLESKDARIVSAVVSDEQKNVNH